MSKIEKTDAEWRKEMSAEDYHICRCGGTEAPFTGQYWDTKIPGVYTCSGCDAALFYSDTKYDSGSGWPSFYAAINQQHLKEITDTSLGMVRTEIKCAACDSHLGHVFPDGPAPTGLRYCVNSASLKLVEK